MHNVEKSKFQKGMYVGYGGGAVWHIRNYGKGNWKATPQGNNKHQVFSCATLRDVSTQLETLSAKPMDATHRAPNPAPRKYSGKYPRRIQSVGSAGGETVFQLNDGSVYKVPTKMLIDLGYRNQSPGPGTDFDLMIGNDFDYVQHAIKTVRKTNPAPRKRAISRPSQVTKKAPTKRLVARRKKAAAKPVKGYFPNPRKAEKLVTLQIEIDRGNGWEFYTNFQHGKSHVRAITEMAKDAAQHAAKMNPSWMVRVIKK